MDIDFIKLLKKWQTGSLNQQIASGALVVALFSGIAKLLLLSRELVLAANFGTNDVLDAFWMAYLIPSFFVNILTSVLFVSLIPAYMEVQETQGQTQAKQFVAQITAWNLVLCLVLLIIGVIVIALFLPVFASGFNEQKINLTFQLAFALIPLILLGGVASGWLAFLNAEKFFSLPAALPGVTSVTVIIFILLAGANIWWVVMGLLVGQFAELVLAGLLMVKKRLPVLPEFSALNPQIKAAFGQYVPSAAGALLMGSTLVVDQSFAASLNSGSVSILNYGNRIVSFPLNMLAVALSTAVFPYLAQMSSQQNWRLLKVTLRRFALILVAGSLPLVAVLWFFAEPLIKLTLERGAFTAADTARVVQVQQLAALQIPFYLVGTLIVRTISAVRKNEVLMIVSVFNLVINILADWYFSRWLGVAGIALSTSVVYAFSCTLNGIILWHVLLKEKNDHA